MSSPSAAPQVSLDSLFPSHALRDLHRLTPHQIREVASLKLALVGLKGFEDYYPSQISVAYPWERSQQPKYQVQVEVLRFEANTQQLVELWARWSIMDSAKKTVSVRESYLTHPARDKSTEASVASMSEAVSDLSKEIAAAVSALTVAQGR